MGLNEKKRITFEARRQFEAQAIDSDSLVKLYEQYSDVGDTLRFVKTAKDIFPLGNCGLATLYLKEKIGGTLVQGKYENADHTFLLNDQVVIDITADQFGGPKVYVGPLKSPWSYKF
ncbi:MAG: hypothetical protein P4M11_05170 [Candidatus Pacebacteria bacterium]|nr:hypothetical protein [Candidatus Paceibacterota bacterium]